MSRKRVQRPQRKSRRVGTTKEALVVLNQTLRAKSKAPKLHRFLGVSLGGGKTDKTCLSVIEYYPVQRKIFLSRLYDKIRTEGELSADLQLYDLIAQCPGPVESVSFDVPLSLPLSFLERRGALPYEQSQEPHIQWMWKHYRNLVKKKSPPRLFTPYTERCVEQYLATELEEPFHLQHALGSNLAPLTARAQYLTRRLEVPSLEVFPKLSLFRMGNSLNIAKSHLRYHRHWEGGQGSRQVVLNKMMEKNLAFIYDQDLKILVDSPQAFDSFICALTGLLSFLGHCEPRPRGFPPREAWILIPKKVFAWP